MSTFVSKELAEKVSFAEEIWLSCGDYEERTYRLQFISGRCTRVYQSSCSFALIFAHVYDAEKAGHLLGVMPVKPSGFNIGFGDFIHLTATF